MVARAGKLTVPNFSAGGIAAPADAALMMQLGAEAIFVGSGIFMKERATPLDVENNPRELEEAVSRAKAIVIATTHYKDPKILAEASEQVTGTMKGLTWQRGSTRSQLIQTLAAGNCVTGLVVANQRAGSADHFRLLSIPPKAFEPQAEANRRAIPCALIKDCGKRRSKLNAEVKRPRIGVLAIQATTQLMQKRLPKLVRSRLKCANARGWLTSTA